MSATDLERLSRRIGLVEQQLLERLLRLEARMDALDKRAGLAGELSIERCQREIDAIMRRGDDEEVLA
jgi:hypothetical protein